MKTTLCPALLREYEGLPQGLCGSWLDPTPDPTPGGVEIWEGLGGLPKGNLKLTLLRGLLVSKSSLLTFKAKLDFLLKALLGGSWLTAGEVGFPNPGDAGLPNPGEAAFPWGLCSIPSRCDP